MSMLQATSMHIEDSTFNNIGRDQIIQNFNNGTSQTTPSPFVIVRTYGSFQPLCSTS